MINLWAYSLPLFSFLLIPKYQVIERVNNLNWLCLAGQFVHSNLFLSKSVYYLSTQSSSNILVGHHSLTLYSNNESKENTLFLKVVCENSFAVIHILYCVQLWLSPWISLLRFFFLDNSLRWQSQFLWFSLILHHFVSNSPESNESTYLDYM